jgi:Flp pilus assembly secretin CpaC/Flp pilus assembly protein TadD
MSCKIRHLLIAFVVGNFWMISGCATTLGPQSPELQSEIDDISKNIPASQAHKLETPLIVEGLEAFKERKFQKASKAFNQALKYNPRNAGLHFMNALVYHQQAEVGDSSQYESAEMGYKLALQFEPSMSWAAYQLGNIALKHQQYFRAQEFFAYAILYDKKNPQFLNGLAVASYYARDLESGLSAARQAVQVDRKHPGILRNAVMASAAAADFNLAKVYLDRYQLVENSPLRLASLTQRVEDWKQFHGDQAPILLAQDLGDASDIFSDPQTTEGVTADATQDDDEDYDGPGDDPDGDEGDSAKVKKVPTKMCVVDVIIIRSEERYTTNKGVNLLNGLKVTFSGNIIDYANNTTTGTTTADSQQFNSAFKTNLGSGTSGSITYNLNIFNNNDDYNEVLARPSLIALDGETSDFFSGSVQHIELSDNSGNGGNLVDLPVGISLSVTPKFLDGDMVKLNVRAARSFFEGTANGSFTEQVRTTKTLVTANVAMKFEQTLILSGLTEKEEENIQDGVPILESIPGLQYFFSNEQTVDFKKSVMVLLTPHEARYVYKNGEQVAEKVEPKSQDRRNLNALKSKRKDWFKPVSSLDAAFAHLDTSQVFREFRAGDVAVEEWDEFKTQGAMVRRALKFLYY